MASTTELEAEQKHFDRAAEARERTRQTLREAPASAAGSRAAAASVKRGADRHLAKLGPSDEPTAFAMFVDEDGEALYLGKHVISDSDRNKLVINWQAPAATPYFEASFEDPCGVVKRRKYSTERNRVLDFDEVIFAELAAAVEQLTEADRQGIDDAVLRDLEQGRDGEMRDIVQTIHAAQYALIRSELNQLLVIQGGPGTGKTAVALHRVSWLLWNHASELAPRDVLVVGPNPTFTKYIRKVLPGLGDEDVQHLDLASVGPIASNGRVEDLDVQRLKGEGRMAELLQRGLAQRVRFPGGADTLDIGAAGRTTKLPRAQVEAAARRSLQGGTTYSTGRQSFRAWVVQQLSGDTQPTQIDNAVDRVWPALSPQQFLRELLGSRERLVAAAGDDFTAGDVQRLLRPAASKASEETWSDADVALLDEAQALISGRPDTYGHVVLDEAQDLSPMQLRSIRRRSRGGSMTVVGDIAQSTGAWARDSWEEVVDGLQQQLPSSVEELTLGYRVPQQIYALAAELLPVAAPGVTPPRVVRSAPTDPALLNCPEGEQVLNAVQAARDYAGRGLFVGVVVPDALRKSLCEALNEAGIVWSDAARGQLSTSINVLSAEQSKGLEFDAVVIVEPVAIANESASGLRLLYVALTRSTRYLTVAHAGPLLPTPLDDSEAGQGQFEAPAAIVEVPDPIVDGPATTNADAPTPETARRRNGVQPKQEPLFGMTPVMPDDVDAEQQAPNPPAAGPLSISKVSRAIATSLADEIRDSATRRTYADILEALRMELGVTEDEVLDRLTK